MYRTVCTVLIRILMKPKKCRSELRLKTNPRDRGHAFARQFELAVRLGSKGKKGQKKNVDPIRSG